MSRAEHLQAWRKRPAEGRTPEAIAARVDRKAADKERALAGAVDRDPCTYCGIRADIGCKHNRWAA